jgi:DNA-binding response OmpR family regulator
MLNDAIADAARRRLLIVENETHIRELLRSQLESAGYSCHDVETGREALEAITQHPFDLIVLDLMLPGVSGLDVCRALRAGDRNRDALVLMLTARDEESDKIEGFQSGADDYVTKPFSMAELTARVGALTRRRRQPMVDPLAEAPIIEHGDLRIDPPRRQLRVRGELVPLTPYEFKLLYELASRPGLVCTRHQLLTAVWHGEAYVTVRSVDTLVRRLRCKIELDASTPRYLTTVWGEGYRFAHD